MLIKSLTLKNIGPFKNETIEFPTERNFNGLIPVTIITGENGSGKSIILDAIRALLKGIFKIERDIIADEDFYAKIVLEDEPEEIVIESEKRSVHGGGGFDIKNSNFYSHFSSNTASAGVVNWIIEYWSSKLSNDSYSISNLSSIKVEDFLLDALSGIQKNVKVTEVICYFDYLKTSDDLNEHKLGQLLFSTLKEAIKKCLSNGELQYVSRKTLDPIILQNGQSVTLDKLSSGNLLLIQRVVSLIGKLYAVFILNNKPIDDFFKTTGILLIDEAENHLHPKWQKTFIDTVQTLFPYLQIILTTHSPFIVASTKNARVFVCSPQTGYSTILDETDEYSNSSIDEILLTPVFNTQPFNKEISDLIKNRKTAIKEKNDLERKRIEIELLKINPEYFSYFSIENTLKNIL